MNTPLIFTHILAPLPASRSEGESDSEAGVNDSTAGDDDNVMGALSAAREALRSRGAWMRGLLRTSLGWIGRQETKRADL